MVISAFLFPVPLTYLMTTPNMLERYADKKDAFDGLFNMVLGYGVQFLLPCIIGVIAAILFFMERDNDTFKNLRTIPVTSTQMILAKIIVLFIFEAVFCVASTFATFICGSFTTEIYGIGYKF
ncbi:MAG: ABC transporter permease [Anaerococcus sp.]|nr:ABC transporter permease [Anaerococcus sp.]MDU1829059.1 ABC transporter permease [Anaerococcus sp.]MDU1865292.1 ABC transporter permease [Anaerococcus sp.]